MKYLIVLSLILASCSSTPKHRFTYSDGYYEDTYTCYLFPTPLEFEVTRHSLDAAHDAAKWVVKDYKIPSDYVQCYVQTNR